MDLNIEEIQEIIAQNEKKYLQERRFKLNRVAKEIELSSLSAFLEWFLSNEETGNINTCCIWEDANILPRPRFPISVDNAVQCPQGKNRSTHDLFLLSKYYFPETTLQEVIYTLVDLNENLKISSLQCPHIEARVWPNGSGRTDVVSSYDKMNGKNEEGIYKNWLVLTDGLNYLHLKKLYEYIKEEVAA